MADDSGLALVGGDSRFIDVHCHQLEPERSINIISMDCGYFNPDHLPAGFYSLGLHPWFIQGQNCQSAMDKIAKAAGSDHNLLAIGECGLDKAIHTDFSLQLEVFHNQIALAEQFSKPLIIHCVRAFSELLHIKKLTRSKQSWIIHGFNGNPILAGQLLKQGFYLSFGKSVLAANSNTRQIVQTMPPERLFLETDNSGLPIELIYAHAAGILGVDINTLQQRLFTNFERVFLSD